MLPFFQVWRQKCWGTMKQHWAVELLPVCGKEGRGKHLVAPYTMGGVHGLWMCVRAGWWRRPFRQSRERTDIFHRSSSYPKRRPAVPDHTSRGKLSTQTFFFFSSLQLANEVMTICLGHMSWSSSQTSWLFCCCGFKYVGWIMNPRAGFQSSDLRFLLTETFCLLCEKLVQCRPSYSLVQGKT